MRRVYLSFLGIGSFNQETKQYEYKETTYSLRGRKLRTKFVQVAEVETIGADQFDQILIVATQASYDLHFFKLKQQLHERGVLSIDPIKIEEDMTAKGQWKWFEKILSYIEPNDNLTIDLTHGYRSIPIVFSTAINFLQQARNISLNAVYYGAFEKAKELGYTPIVDMKDFYIINEWAEAVSRLVDDADARKMAEISAKTSDFQIGELNNPEIINAFEDLTNTIRNVDINNVAIKAEYALNLIEEKEKTASVTGKILLKLVIDKFASLTHEIPQSGRYDKNYFLLQIEIIRLLLKHKLYMQAYTVMREFIGSIGMIPIANVKINSKKGRSKRHQFSEVFVRMLANNEKEWEFKDEEKRAINNKLMPFYDKLKGSGIEKILRDFAKDLGDYRNGFDHAWTSKSSAKEDIEEKGEVFFNKLNEVVTLFDKNNFFVSQEE